MGLMKWLQDDTTKKITKEVYEAMREHARARRDTVNKLFQLEIAEVTERGCEELLQLEKDMQKEFENE